MIGVKELGKRVSGVVDRISEGKYAVILVESLKKEFIVDINTVDVSLREGLWLDLILDANDKIQQLTPNEQLTKKNEQKVDDLMSKLRKRKGSKFKS